MTSEELREARRQLRITQVDLAKLVGVPSPVMCRMESGQRKVDLATRVVVGLMDKHPELITDMVETARQTDGRYSFSSQVLKTILPILAAHPEDIKDLAT